MLVKCPIHGPSGVCIFSQQLLTVQEDGTLPNIITVEVKDSPDDIAFFRFNISPQEMEKYSVVNGSIPFDLKAFEIMRDFSQMCGCCFEEQRKALERQQPGG